MESEKSLLKMKSEEYIKLAKFFNCIGATSLNQQVAVIALLSGPKRLCEIQKIAGPIQIVRPTLGYLETKGIIQKTEKLKRHNKEVYYSLPAEITNHYEFYR